MHGLDLGARDDACGRQRIGQRLLGARRGDDDAG
jgi:hypothetical protein